MRERVLSHISEQKAKLKKLLEKFNSIALVSHSQNIKSFIGYEPANCSIFEYHLDFFDMGFEEMPKNEL